MKLSRVKALSKLKKYLLPIILSLALVLLILTVIVAVNSDRQKIKNSNNKERVTYYRVTSVIDGDTIELDNGNIVRYLDIDTPETSHPKIGLQCYGNEATAYNKKLVEGKRVRLISDVTDKDNYGRLLRHVFTEDGTFVNFELVLKGYAQVSEIPPDTLFYKTFVAAQQSALKSQLGIWGMCLKNQGG